MVLHRPTPKSKSIIEFLSENRQRIQKCYVRATRLSLKIFLRTAMLWASKIAQIIGMSQTTVKFCRYKPFLSRYLKRIFKDLFERQNFEDDGIFDWDILKKNKDISGGPSSSLAAGGVTSGVGIGSLHSSY
jgi:hypothetical protein